MENLSLAKAGGGVSATQTHSDRITTFSPAVLKHIEALHHELAKKYNWTAAHNDLGLFFQDMQKTPRSEYNQLLNSNESTFQGLLSYLASPNASILGPIVGNDLSYPMPNYYISTSHNTYLTGNQLSSHSSAEVYRNVLLRGCRSVEIDVWDGKISGDDDEQPHGLREHLGFTGRKARDEDSHGWRDRLGLRKDKSGDNSRASQANPPEDSDELRMPTPWVSTRRAEPRVLHGHTLTKEVSFREVCETIRDSAFTTSDLPVIVSLEIHASHEQQEIMVDIMTHVWRGLLVKSETASPNGSDAANALPAPAELRRKILVKVKYTPPEVAKKQRLQSSSPKSTAMSGSVSSGSSDDENEPKSKSKKLLGALSELGVYTRSYHFKSFDQPEAKVPTHVFSLSEHTLSEAQETSAAALFQHNQNFLMRAYPKGSRVSSSNLDPPLFWRQGVQMAALNWQACDKGIMLNEGMFADTGGWVLKPLAFRSDPKPSPVAASQSSSGPTQAHTVSSSNAEGGLEIMDLEIECFAAQNIPLPSGTESTGSFRPFIRSTLHIETLEQKKERGHFTFLGWSHKSDPTDGDSPDARLNARTRPQHGTDPDFRGEVLSFKGIVVDEEALTFVRFKVVDDVEMGRNDLAGWACIRLDRLRQGIRTVRFFDANGKVSEGMMLVRVSKHVRPAGKRGVPGPGAVLPLR